MVRLDYDTSRRLPKCVSEINHRTLFMNLPLIVSKILEPPFNDGSKNLAFSVARGLAHLEPLSFVAKGSDFAEEAGLSGIAIRGAGSGSFAPGLREKLPILGHLLFKRDIGLHHYFFAPNPATAHAGRLVRAIRRLPTLHTITSAPRAETDLRSCLFADHHVALSRATEARLLDAGLERERVHRIPAFVDDPSLGVLDATSIRAALGLPRSGALLVFPGDLEFGEGARLTIDTLARLRHEDLIVAIAARPKTPAAIVIERELRAHVEALKLESRVFFLGELAQFHALLAAADIVSLPSYDLYGKTDQPLAILEAMALARPVIVAAGSAAEELGEGNAALVAECNIDALARAVTHLLGDEERKRRGLASRQAYLERFTPEVNLPKYERLYRSLLGSP